jgi:hypothetical protein
MRVAPSLYTEGGETLDEEEGQEEEEVVTRLRWWGVAASHR